MKVHYRICAEWKDSVKADLYWIEKKEDGWLFKGPWRFVNNTMTFEKSRILKMFDELRYGTPVNELGIRIIEEATVEL